MNTNLRPVHRIAALCMFCAAALAIAGFTALGSIFDYPEILDAPTGEILTAYRLHQGAVMFWFGVLCVGAALLAPIGVLLGRVVGGTVGRWIAGLGIAAATVQVVGLSRWVVLIPGVSHDALDPANIAAAHTSFERLHFWLGEIVGETAGYALSAMFTLLVTMALTRRVAPPWMSYAGYASAALIATGVLIPLGLDAASVTNFVGYILWTLWLIAMAVCLWRSKQLATIRPTSTAAAIARPVPSAS